MPKSRVGSASNNSVTTSGTAGGIGRTGSLSNVIGKRVQKVTCKNGKNCGNNVCG